MTTALDKAQICKEAMLQKVLFFQIYMEMNIKDLKQQHTVDTYSVSVGIVSTDGIMHWLGNSKH